VSEPGEFLQFVNAIYRECSSNSLHNSWLAIHRALPWQSHRRPHCSLLSPWADRILLQLFAGRVPSRLPEVGMTPDEVTEYIKRGEKITELIRQFDVASKGPNDEARCVATVFRCRFFSDVGGFFSVASESASTITSTSAPGFRAAFSPSSSTSSLSTRISRYKSSAS